MDDEQFSRFEFSGMCGNFNGRPGDDMQLNGAIIEDIATFAESQKVNPACDEAAEEDEEADEENICHVRNPAQRSSLIF